MKAYDSFIGQTFEGRYTIVNVIGIGGMATVYGAYDQVSGRSVAIKMMNKKLEHNARQIKLFVNESTALSLLSHPNIVQVYNTVITNSTKYIIMEYVEGITLKKHVDHRGALPEREVIYYATQILSALDYIHSKNIVHCDIKPQNIILLQNGSIKVADFGIARLDAMLDRSKEKSDVALGTVYYVSPEQAQGKAPQAESDLYSLGVMLYEAMTNRLPFYHDDPTEVTKMQINKEPTPPSVYRPDISIGLEQIILRAMEKNPKKRYATAMEMLTDIRALRQNEKTVFGNEKNSSRYRIIERKAYTNAPNVSNRTFYPLNDRGNEIGNNLPHIKKSSAQSGPLCGREIEMSNKTIIVSGPGSDNMGRPSRAPSGPVRAPSGPVRAPSGPISSQSGPIRSQSGPMRVPSGPIQAQHPHKPIPPASNTVVIDNSSELRESNGGNIIPIMLGVIAALILVILLSLGVWFIISPSDTVNEHPTYLSTETETQIEWNIEHTERF